MSKTATQTPARLPYGRLAPRITQALAGVSGALAESSLDKGLIDLAYLRTSQLNGCAYCVDLHWRDLIAQGADTRKLNTLAVWHESPFFTLPERAALAWVDALTNVQQTHAPDEVFEGLRAHFSEQQIVELSFAVACMSAWNRIGIGLRQPISAD